MNKPVKGSKPSTKNKKSALSQPNDNVNEFKLAVWVEDFTDCMTFKTRPMTDTGLIRIADELVKWAEKDKTQFKTGPFLRSKGIPRQTWEGWIKRYPVIAQADDTVRWILGDRREQSLIERDPSAVSFMMPYYDSRWKEMVEWKNKLKEQVTGNSKSEITVIIPQAENSPMVPLKKKDDL